MLSSYVLVNFMIFLMQMYMTVLIKKTSYDFSLKYYELFCGLDDVPCTLENVYSEAIK